MKSTKIKTYSVIKNAISKELADFLKDYLILKSQVHNHYKKDRIISPFNTLFGEAEDRQVPGSYCTYGDIAMDNLLVKLKDKIEKCVKKKLIETYSYSRVYVKGAELKRHKDRFSCELSTTLNLGGDPWSIYVDTDPSNLDTHIENTPYKSPNNKGTRN
jgi:tRNA G37 N-methylase Trm5